MTHWFADPTPVQEGCDLARCTDRVGGDHAPTCLRCGICDRDTSDGLYINVSKADGSVERVCDLCVERADEGLTTGLDYTEDEINREGEPAFNGAFDRW